MHMVYSRTTLFQLTQRQRLCSVLSSIRAGVSDLCEISDLVMFFSYFASQNKEIKSVKYFSDVCFVN